MAYCYLEEAWGDNYKSFLSPASITPEWLGKCKEMDKIKGDTVVKAHSNKIDKNKIDKNKIERDQIEHFTSIRNTNRDTDDEDLRVDYDEFNLPLHWDAPQGIDSMDDDYYRLINESNEGSGPGDVYESFNDYAEENQFSSTFTQDCAQAFPPQAQYHLKKCVQCRKRIRKLLESFDYIDESIENESIRNKSIGNTSNGNESNKNESNSLSEKVRRFLPKGPLIDLLVFIAFGVFVIFILDAFVRLGKNLKRGISR